MSKYANVGELKTEVFFKRIVKTIDDYGFETLQERDVFTDNTMNPLPIMAKWVNFHGAEIYSSMQLKLRDLATITIRYSPLIDVDLILYRNGDPSCYEVISVDNVENRNRWLEIKIARRIAAR